MGIVAPQSIVSKTPTVDSEKVADERLLDHFSVAEFLACVESGWEGSLSGREAQFLFDVEKRFTEFRESMRFSVRQAAYLRALARRGGRVAS